MVIRLVDFVLHQAALGSVPRSIEDPRYTNRTNIDGFLNMLAAARDAKVKVLSMQHLVQRTVITRTCLKLKIKLATH